MTRETISFIVFFAMLAALFWFGGTDWRAHQQDYRRSAVEHSRQTWEQRAPRPVAAIPPDSLLARLEATDLAGRIERLADSLTAIRSELDGYEGLLLAARDALAGLENDSGSGAEKYFGAVRAYRRLDGIAAGLEAEIDSLRLGMRAVQTLSGDGKNSPPARINWLTPAKVPVREACTTCHLPLNGKARVMLYPDSSQAVDYPEVMAGHDYRQFGCTVCHAGDAGSLDFRTAHGPDHLLRPFRPGKLALRGCGICHAERSPLTNSSVAFSWPESCAGCHGGDSLSVLADSAANPALDAPLDERELRGWLLHHWGEQTGVIPKRPEYESALAMLVSGDVRRMTVEQFLDAQSTAGQPAPGADSLAGGTLATCPSCGRKFKLSLESRAAYCPVDGTLLVADRSAR